MKDIDIKNANIQGLISEIKNPNSRYENLSFVGTIDKQVSVVLPVGLIAYVDAIADRAQESRSAIIRDILRASLYDILNGLDDETRKTIEESAKNQLPDLVPDKMKVLASRFTLSELCEQVEA